MPVTGEVRFERFFRTAVGLRVDASDLKRYQDFVDRTIYGLLIVAQETASANGRDVIEPADLPMTRGLRENIRAFERLDERIELRPILEHIVGRPPLDLAISDATEERMPAVVGGASLALARAFRIIDPRTRNPSTDEWEKALAVFDLLL